MALAALLALPAPAFADDAAEALPTIGIDEITRGMTGHGLSVFAGREPERFEAEVVGVMRNNQPGTSFILARLSGHGLEESGIAAGMSGSPVWLDGRLAGAVAFAWPFSQEAIAGITPIGAMRELTLLPAGGAPKPPLAAATSPVTLDDLVAGRLPEDLLETSLAAFTPRLGSGAVAGMQWAASGFGTLGEDLLRRGLGGVAPLGVAVPMAGEAADDGSVPALTHGSAVAAVMVDGDLRLAATGTVTDVVGDRVLAFGHPFLGLGPVEIPMATSEVVTVLASDYSSFKISNVGSVVGAFEQDRTPGIQGRVGGVARTIPLSVKIHGDREEEYSMRVARVPQLTATLIAVATLGCLDSTTFSSGRQGIDLVARFALADHGELTLEQSFDGDSAAINSVSNLLSFASYLVANDLAEVDIESVDVELTQVQRPRTATLVGAHADRSVLKPGDRVRLNLDFSAWRGEDFRRTLELDLPEDLPEGPYYLFVGDGTSVDAARMLIEQPEPESLRQALTLLRSLHSRRDLVVLGVARGAGLAVAGETMPNLPGSVRSIWSAAPSGSAKPLRLAVSQQYVEVADRPLSGLVRVDVEVERREPLRSDGSPGGDDGGADDGGGDSSDGGDSGGDGGEANATAEAAAGTPSSDAKGDSE